MATLYELLTGLVSDGSYRTELPGVRGMPVRKPASVRMLEAGGDYIPGYGDVTAMMEAGQALSEGELLAAGLLGTGAAIGLVPGAGDAIARPVMAAGRRVGEAIPSEVLYAGRSVAQGDPRGILEAFAAGREARSLSAAAETPTGIRAYHGSPHDFPSAVRVLDKETGRTYVQDASDPVTMGMFSIYPDRYSIVEENPLGMFDFSKMGTGEGAQAYGWGGYFAQAEPVARGYRDALSARAAPNDAQGNAYDLVQRMGGDEAWTAETLRDAIENAVSPNTKQFFEDTLKHVENRTYVDYVPPAGRMYEVNINANPEDFLDWDKPLSEQPEAARIMGYADPDEIAAAKRAAYAEFSAPTGDTFEDLFAPLNSAEQAAAERLSNMPASWGNMTGKDAYYALQSQGFREGAVGANLPQPNPMKKADKWASEWLKGRGVPGIKYFDAMSRNAGEGSRNFVVFDENLINIVRKYGIAGAAAVLGVSVADVEAAMAQGQPAPRTPALLVQ